MTSTKPTDSRAELRKALGWFGSATLVMRALDILTTVAVLRFVTQEQLGLASLSMSTAVIAETLSGLGVASAIVQAKQVSKDEQSTLFWWCLGVAVTLALAVLAGSRVLAQLYEDPSLAPLVAASGLKFVTVGAAVVPLQMLTRELKFKQVSLAQTAATAGEAVTKIVLAALGFGAWALVISNVLRGLYLLVALYSVAPFVPRWHFSSQELKPFVRFGARAALAGLVGEAYRNVDYFLVGKFLGMSTLGVYRVAFDLAMVPAEAIAQPIYRVTFPLFSRLVHDTNQLIEAFLRATRYLLVLSGPVAVVVFFAGDDLLRLISAERWLGAVPALSILCWTAVMRVSTRMFSNLFMAAGRPGLALLDASLTFVVLTATMVTLLHFFSDSLGMLAVCFAWLLAYPILFGLFWRIAGLVVRIELWAYGRAVLPIFLALGASWLGGAAAARGIAAAGGLPPLINVLVLAAAVVGTFAVCLRWGLGLRLRELKPSNSKPTT